MSDLFVRLMKYTGEKEDFFTECLAAALREDAQLSRAFVCELCGDQVDGIPIPTTNIDLKTQERFPDTQSRIDMVFRLGGELTLGVENKLWAAEGVSPRGERQLERYLRVKEVDRLAFITGYDAKVTKKTLRHPKYLRPRNGRDHFLWSDVYRVVEAAGTSLVNRATLGLLARLGFDPPAPLIGDLLHPEAATRKRNRGNFAKLWGVTRHRLKLQGWDEIGRGSIAQLYIRKGKAKRLSRAWLDPIHHPNWLRVRLDFRQGISIVRMRNELLEADLPLKEFVEIAEENVRRVKGQINCLEVRIPQSKLFEGASDPEAISRRLADFVLAVFDKAG